MFHFENSYYIPNAHVLGYSCKTNLPSNTAFRGFGGPQGKKTVFLNNFLHFVASFPFEFFIYRSILQGLFAGEHIIRDVAAFLKKDFTEIGKNSWLTVLDSDKFD